MAGVPGGPAIIGGRLQALRGHADRLREAGYTEEQVERIVKQARDGLANLQLLPGGENIGKSERLPLEWARAKYPNPDALRGFLEQNDMGDLPEKLDGFLDFYEARRERLRQRLVGILGREPGSLAEADPEVAPVPPSPS
jgi:hypothetical protein